MTDCDERCPFLVPVMADRLWVYPVPAYCRRPQDNVRIPGVETFMRLCLTDRYVTCPGYQASLARAENTRD